MSVDLKDKKIILTISREYGSGGRRICKLVSAELGIPFYDKDLLNRAAQESCIDKEVFDNMDEKRCTSLLFSIVRKLDRKSNSVTSTGDSGIFTMNERLFMIQKQVIKNIAKEGSCIIIGRCSNEILKGDPDAIHFFINAPEDYKIKLLKQYENLEPNAAKKIMTETDKERMSYYNYYTGKKWGNHANYNYTLDSSVLGVEETAGLICDIVRRKLGLK